MVAMRKKVAPFELAIIGAGGDLGRKKIIPALFALEKAGWLPDEYRLLPTSRSPLDHERLLEEISGAGADLSSFREHVEPVIFDPSGSPDALAAKLAEHPDRQRIFYAAVPPEQYSPLVAALASQGLITADSPIVLEKPIGKDLASYRSINNLVGQHVPEHLIYRIDHYLGKETVQNLLCLRFANLILEPLWNRAYIDHVQITVAEQVGAAGRAGYFDGAGTLRDMVQNHLAQLLCLTAMEPPRHYEADAVRDEKLKVLQCLRPLTAADVVTGQYRSGVVNDEKVADYRTDVGNDASTTETFAALRVHVDNWRWSGVPFYLRSGKRMPVRTSMILVRFREVPHAIFASDGPPHHNQIVIRLQPDEGIELTMHNKIPGPGGLRLKPSRLNLNYTETFGSAKLPDAYERLLLDALRGNATLFMRHDEVEASWQWIESILDRVSPEPYPAGTWGPDSAQLLLAADGRRWANRAEETER